MGRNKPNDPKYFHKQGELRKHKDVTKFKSKDRYPNLNAQQHNATTIKKESPASPHKTAHRKVMETKSEKTSSLSNNYFKTIIATLKEGISEEDKAILIKNVLAETKGQELYLSCRNDGSHFVEFLLNNVDDFAVMVHFMKAIDSAKEDTFGNPYASHIIENLLYYALKYIKDTVSNTDQGEYPHVQDSSFFPYVLKWIESLGQFSIDNLETCLQDPYACYTIKILVQVLGGHYVGDNVNLSKKAQAKKRPYEQNLTSADDNSFAGAATRKQPIMLSEVPKSFVLLIKKLAKTFRKFDDITIYAVEATTAPFVQMLLQILKVRVPKYCYKFVKRLSSKLFEEKNSEGMPHALVHKNCSYIVEKMFEVASEGQQEEFWNMYLAEHLEKLLVHPIANFTLQRLFAVVTDKNQFQMMCNSALDLLGEILDSRHYGMLLSIATSCNRLKEQQAQFVNKLMQCLQCLNPDDRQILFIPLLLRLQKYDDFQLNQHSANEFMVTLHGSLVAQEILKFQKPTKAVSSILSMKPLELSYLAYHTQGCHVLRCFFESKTVGDKSKDKLLHAFKPVLSSVASDRSGSLTLSRIWVLLSIKQKIILAEELVKQEDTLRCSNIGFGLFKKCQIHEYKRNNSEWRTSQEKLTRNVTNLQHCV